MLSLVSMERQIDSLCTFDIGIYGNQFPLKIMVLEFKMHRKSYNVQVGCKRFYHNEIVYASTREDEELQTDCPYVPPWMSGCSIECLQV